MEFGAGTINLAAGAVSDLFAAEGHRYKAEGDRIEAKNYELASTYSSQNALFQDQSIKIKDMQLDRQIYGSLGQTKADVGNAGLAMSGSALDLLHDSASQGALTKAVAGQQGLITEAGYQEQAQSYTNMAAAANVAAKAEDTAAMGADITSGIKGAGAIASLFLPF